MNKKVFFGATLIMLGAQVISAQEVNQEEKVNELDEVVISDSKFKLKREQSGKVITKISSEELERSQGQSLATVLNRVAGIEINGSNSGAGKNLNYNIRGGSNRQVVIRIDGVTVNDPSTISGEFDLRLLALNQIESIEILKGASSTLFGSGAATGVINIITKKESKKAISAQFSSSLGTNQSQEDQEYDVNEFVNSASINGTIGKVNYLASFSNQFTDGLSEAEKLDEDTSSQEFESDSYSKYNVYAKLGYQWNKNFRFHFFGNIDDYKNEFDVGNGIDGNNNGTSRQVRGGSFWEAKYPNGSFTFVDSYALLEREFLTDFPSRSESRVYTFDAYNKYKFGNWLYTVIGANGSYNDYNGFSASGRGEEFIQTINDHQADFDIIDPYVNLVYVSDFGFQVNAGARLNIHSAYGNHMVYNVNPSFTYTFGGNYIKGLASYSTAYITPSLFQLFSPSFGNSDLEPEENSTIEVGAELSLDKKTTMSAVYFTRNQENAVDFIDTGNFVFQYQNISEEFTTDGLEFEVSSKLMNDKMVLRGNFTYTNVDEELSRIGIPEIKFNASIGYNMSSKSFVSLSYQYNDEREGRFTDFTTFASESRTLNSYGILDFYISHQLMDNLSIYAAMNNITNEDYQEVFGFSTRGRNARIGFNLKF